MFKLTKYFKAGFFTLAILGGAIVIIVGVASGQTKTIIRGPEHNVVLWEQKTAVDLEFVVEKDHLGNVIKIYRYILWSDGTVTIPEDIPHYAIKCQDCPTICDVDGDGIVGIADLLAVQENWGISCQH